MKVSKPKTEKQLRHPGSRSESHRRDKKEGEARQTVAHIAVPAGPSPSPKRNLAGLEAFEMAYVGPFKWRYLPGPDDLGDLMVNEARRRRHYIAPTTRHGQPVLMKRTDASPIHVLTFSLHPAFSDFLAEEIAAGRQPMPVLRETVLMFLTKVEQAFQGLRYLIGMALHVDTDDPHIDIIVSRNGPDGRLPQQGLRTVGPWFCAVLRQISAGATISPGKQAKLDRAVDNFFRRYPELNEPFDIMLMRHLDLYSRSLVGGERFDALARAYAARVPELERAHAHRQLAQLEEARKQLMADFLPEGDGGLSIPKLPAPEIG